MTGSDMGQLLLSFLQVIFGVIGALFVILAGLAYGVAAPTWVVITFVCLMTIVLVLAILCNVLLRIAEHRQG